MSEYEDEDLERRLDRTIAASVTASPEEAVTALAAVRTTLDERLERTPTSPDAHDELGRCLGALADAHARAGRIGTALELTEKAIAQHREAESHDPLGASRRTPIAAVQLRRSTFLTHVGRLTDALNEAETAAAAVDEEIRDDTDRAHAAVRFIGADAHRHLAWLYARTGAPEQELPERERALALGQEGLAIDDPPGAIRAHAASLREISHPRAVAGDLPGALDALTEARRLLDQGGARAPLETSWQHDIAITRAWAGRLLRDVGRLDEARGELEQATFVAENLLALAPEDPRYREAYVDRLEERGDLAFAGRDAEAARAAYEQRLEAARRLLGDDPLAIGRALLDLARATAALGDDAATVNALEEATATISSAGADDLNAREALADTFERLAGARAATGDADGRVAALRDAVGIRAEIHERVPDHHHAASAHIQVLGGLGDALRESGRLDEALEAHGEELRLARQRTDASGESHAQAWSDVATAAGALARTLEPLGRLDEALQHAADTVDARRRMLDTVHDGDRGSVLRAVCWDLRRLARLRAVAGDHAAALALLEEALVCVDDAPGNTGALEQMAWTSIEGACRETLAAVHEAAGRLEEALDEREREHAVARRLADTTPSDRDAWWNVARAATDAAALAGRLGRTTQALARHDDAVEARERNLELAPGTHLGVRRELGFALYARAWARSEVGRTDEALADAERSLDLDREVLAASPQERSFRGAVAASLEAVAWIAQAHDDVERMESAAREEVGLRRVLAEGGDTSDRRSLAWALYAHGVALRDLGRPLEARPVIEESATRTEALLADDPDEPYLLGLLANVAEVTADVLPRDEPALVTRARALYARCVDIHERFTPDEIGHDKECTCLADTRRKIADIDAGA